MKRYLNFIRNQRGFLVLEWSWLTLVTLFLICMILPDLIMMGKLSMDTHGGTSYAISRVAEQGHMTTELSSDVIAYYTDRGYENFELYATGSLVGFNDPDPTVKVTVVNRYRPLILSVMPDIRLSNSIAKEDGYITLTSTKTDISNVYVR